MEIEHHKWPSRKDWNSRMAKPWGISILSWRSRVVFNPLITSEDPINHIVIYSRNFQQAIVLFPINKSEKDSKRWKTREIAVDFVTVVISRIFLQFEPKNSWKHVGFQLMDLKSFINWNPTCFHEFFSFRLHKIIVGFQLMDFKYTINWNSIGFETRSCY